MQDMVRVTVTLPFFTYVDFCEEIKVEPTRPSSCHYQVYYQIQYDILSRAFHVTLQCLYGSMGVYAVQHFISSPLFTLIK